MPLTLAPLPISFSAGDLIPNVDHPDPLISPFLMVGETQRILRDWKKRPSPGIEKKFRESESFKQALDRIREFDFDAILPIPQSYSRAFSLGGGPANRIASLIARELSLPQISGLALLSPHLSPQGQKVGFDRYLNSREYFWNREEKIPKRLLLVDDFWTSGQTVRSATRALKRDGCERVGAFVLGFRPYLKSV